jgi:hypothetical protein
MESIILMRIRVPAGTVTFFVLCAAELAVIAGSAKGPAFQDPAITIPASNAAVRINEFRI